MARLAWLLGFAVARGWVESSPDGGGAAIDGGGGPDAAACAVDGAAGGADASGGLWGWQPSNVDACPGR